MSIAAPLQQLESALAQLQHALDTGCLPDDTEIEAITSLIDQTYVLRELRNVFIYQLADQGLAAKTIARRVNLPASRVGQLLAQRKPGAMCR